MSLRRTRAIAVGAGVRARSRAAAFLLQRPLHHLHQSSSPVRDWLAEADLRRSLAQDFQTLLICRVRPHKLQILADRSGETVACPASRIRFFRAGLLSPLGLPSGEKYFYRNGKDQVAIEDLRERIGFVTQDTQLFSGIDPRESAICAAGRDR